MAEQSSESLPSQFGQLHIGVALYDPATAMVLDANERLEELFGYRTARLRRLSVDEYSANTYDYSSTRLRERFRAAGDGETQAFRWRIKRDDGTLVWVQVHLSALTLGGERRVLAEVRDIEAYTTASQRVGLLSRIMRHNLRNDLIVISGRAEQIASADDREGVAEHVGKIRETASSIDRMTDSVRQIERATTPDAGHREHQRAAAAARRVVADIRERYPAATITVEEATSMWFSVDGTFAQALSHAVENGVVHATDPEPAVTVTVGESPNTGRVEIRVSDHCPPIPDVEIDALDAPGENTSTAHGTGVGLFVMKWSIEALGGEIAFERDGDRGNVVSFYLPPEAPPEAGA
ncbi:PAS domain-containing sensor histidine kinase [Haloarcula onubensis]|uniref:histidine kinase n=1 Tax=Haloarcula onubensis TaxID=2950539 RepID=A0ABU2FR56_9EURY|nr:HAMP domain-containing sensor histidine kinase [Halomicroarcula sp. S3CR25-11]MDS0283254.1 HAMP domain-containing histidine kinase [Halomicroarcula sp. S3CR25-11]